MRTFDPRAILLAAAGLLALGGPVRAQEAVERAPFPGMYLSEEVALVLRTDRVARLISGLTSAQLFDLLAAGEWRTVQRFDVPRAELLQRLGELAALTAETDDERQAARAAAEMMAASFRSLALLERGEERVLVSALGHRSTRAELVRLAREPVVLTGPTPSAGRAWAYPFGLAPFGCITMADTTELHLLYEAPGGVLVRAQFRVPQRPGVHVLSGWEAYGETELALVHGAPSYIAAMAEALRHGLEREVRDRIRDHAERAAEAAAELTDPDEPGPLDAGAFDETGDAEDDEPGVTVLEPTPGVRLTLTVRSVAPLAGEVRFEGLVDRRDLPYTFTAGFRCYHPSPVGAERAGLVAASAPAPAGR